MTVCFRRDFIRAVSGYPDIPLKEDYALWARAIARGARVANLPQVLVRAEGDDELRARARQRGQGEQQAGVQRGPP